MSILIKEEERPKIAWDARGGGRRKVTEKGGVIGCPNLWGSSKHTLLAIIYLSKKKNKTEPLGKKQLRKRGPDVLPKKNQPLRWAYCEKVP